MARHTLRYLINPQFPKAPGASAAITDETPVLAALAAPYLAVPQNSRGAANG